MMAKMMFLGVCSAVFAILVIVDTVHKTNRK